VWIGPHSRLDCIVWEQKNVRISFKICVCRLWVQVLYIIFSKFILQMWHRGYLVTTLLFNLCMSFYYLLSCNIYFKFYTSQLILLVLPRNNFYQHYKIIKIVLVRRVISKLRINRKFCFLQLRWLHVHPICCFRLRQIIL